MPQHSALIITEEGWALLDFDLLRRGVSISPAVGSAQGCSQFSSRLRPAGGDRDGVAHFAILYPTSLFTHFVGPYDLRPFGTIRAGT